MTTHTVHISHDIYISHLICIQRNNTSEENKGEILYTLPNELPNFHNPGKTNSTVWIEGTHRVQRTFYTSFTANNVNLQTLWIKTEVVVQYWFPDLKKTLICYCYTSICVLARLHDYINSLWLGKQILPFFFHTGGQQIISHITVAQKQAGWYHGNISPPWIGETNLLTARKAARYDESQWVELSSFLFACPSDSLVIIKTILKGKCFGFFCEKQIDKGGNCFIIEKDTIYRYVVRSKFS